MNVDKVNLNITNNAYCAQRKQNNLNTNYLGFTGSIPQSVIEKEINALNPKMLKWINKLKHHIGEFQDICINAFGTGLLAPLSIKLNPLSDTDEDTRTYSAWRQPLSAVLAIATQGLVTIPITSKINSMANEGSMNLECNKTPFRDKDYVLKLVKKLNPGLSKKQLEEKADEIVNEQHKNMLNSLRKDNTVYYNIKGEAKPQKMAADKFTDLLNRTVDDMIKDEEKQLKRCQDEKLTKRIERSEFFRNNYDTSKNLLDEMEAKINSTDNVNDISNFLKSKYKSLKHNKADQHLLNIVSETRVLASAGKDEMLKKVQKMQGHVEKYKNFTSKEQVIEAVKASVSDRINSHNEAIDFLNKIKQAIKENKTVSEIEEMFAKQIKEAKKTNKEFRLADKIFSEEVAGKLKALTKSHIEGVKRIATLAGALAVLPVSCALLNWVYPRFMDAVFPNLSSKKHNNVSKELVNEATKNSEVK